MIKEIITTIVIMLTIIIVFAYGISKYEKHECLVWQSEQERYWEAGYYLTDWQLQQCDHYGMDLR